MKYLLYFAMKTYFVGTSPYQFTPEIFLYLEEILAEIALSQSF